MERSRPISRTHLQIAARRRMIFTPAPLERQMAVETKVILPKPSPRPQTPRSPQE